MTATELSCGSCGTALNAKAKFCSECGAAISARTPPAEYKQVTVLFADVVHCMDIAAAVGAERLLEIVTALVTDAAAVVARYGGTVDKFTGDGIMAVFGAPVALEDHALRACRAALAIQENVSRLASEVQRRDGIDLRLRVGLNSGQVIVGEIGCTAMGYTAIGEQVGMAQRMESVAPPGAVMLSQSTARLVAGAAELGPPQRVRIKGRDDAVPARRLLSVGHQRAGVSVPTLVGREWELTTLTAMLDRSVDGRGSVVAVVGPPGIGKTRLVGEVIEVAKQLGVEVFSTFGESHATDIPFHVVARLLRSTGQLSAGVPDADPQDLLLLDDLLGLADSEVELPKIDPDARRRRLTTLINAAQLARAEAAIWVVEDVHWIDEASESMLADFLAVIPQTHSLVLITYRPEYRGGLASLAGAQTIALKPLSDAETARLVADLLGGDPSVGQIREMIAERAAGNPFFAEEMTRDLAERGLLVGRRGSYACHTDVADVSVPATLHATVAARIDRLGPAAKLTLSAAAVIGFRFDRELLSSLGVDPVIDELIAAEHIDQMGFPEPVEYAFRHPLIRTVAYESQLVSDRARLHRILAAAIELRDPESSDQNSALIAEHLEAAGDARTAYGRHMRAATWATNRDIGAARSSWRRAQKIADEMPAEDPDRLAMRIAPRTMLCGTAYRVHEHVAGERFDELRDLCAAAGDKASLAIALAALVMDEARMREASQLSSEVWVLLESIGDPLLTVGLSTVLLRAKVESAGWSDMLQWSQSVIDLADGDPAKGNFIFGSPLAAAFSARGQARFCLGRPEWRDDLHRAVAMARSADAMSYAGVVAYTYLPGIPFGVLAADDRADREIEDALGIADRSGDDVALAFARMTLGVALVHRPTARDRNRGQRLLTDVRDVLLRQGYLLCDVPLVMVYLAREWFRCGERNGAIPLMRAAAEDLFRDGQLLTWGIPATGVLVEALLDRGDESDVLEAVAAIERLAVAPADEGLVIRDVWLLRLRAIVALAHRDDRAYAQLRDRYRDMAKALGFAGHIGWAEAMP